MAKKTGQTSKLRAKLTKLFGLLGSENVGEREAARRKIDEILKVNRKRWNDLTELLQTGKDADEWRDPDDAAPSVASDPGATDPNAFDLLYFTLEDYLYFKHQPQELVAFTLWAMHTFVFDRFMITPRLALLSPVRGCGKSTAIDILERVTCRANKCDHSTTAGLYHVIDTERPTLLLDEVDNLELTTNGPMKAILNSGHKRGGSKLIAKKKFSTFAPAAFGAIGVLPLPLMHRSIVISMERAPRSSQLKRFDLMNADRMERLDTVYRFLFQWSLQCKLNLDPELPKQLHNRRADNWRVLIAVADACGKGDIAREAAIAMSREHQDEDAGVELLKDVRKVFDARNVDRLANTDIVLDLHGLEDSIWTEWRGIRGDQQPRKISTGELSRQLRPFGIAPKTIWPSGPRTGVKSARGYYRQQFEAAWEAYCSDESDTPTQLSKIKRLRKV